MSTKFSFCYSGQLNILMSREQWLRTFYDFEESEEEEYDYPATPIPPPRINTPLNAANLNVGSTILATEVHKFHIVVLILYCFYRKAILKL